MKNRKLLLLSSSKVGDTAYLQHALPLITNQLKSCKNVIFVPFAGVTMSYDEYTARVAEALKTVDIDITGLHTFADKQNALIEADGIIVGGGNTFHLLNELYQLDLLNTIKERVANGDLSYVGWSAGSNIAGNSIRTTNDMPIVEPPSFNALALVDCQLNPHYTEFTPAGFNGETREQRLNEFMVANPDATVIGLIEGTGLQINGSSVNFVLGENIQETLFVFQCGKKVEHKTFPTHIEL